MSKVLPVADRVKRVVFITFRKVREKAGSFFMDGVIHRKKQPHLL